MGIFQTRILTGRPAALSLILFALVLHVTTVRDGHNWQGDFSQYILHAQNLLSGRPYTQLSIVPADALFATGTPPGFPLSIVPVLYLFGLNFIALKLLIVSFWGIALCVYWKIVREDLPHRWALGSLAFLAFTPWMLKFSNTILSDIPYLAVFLLAVYVTQRFFRSRATLQHALLAGLALLLACLFRNVGTILIGTLVVYAALFRRSHLLPTVLIALFSYVTVFLFYTAFGCGSAYLSLFSFDPVAMLSTILTNTSHLKRAFIKYIALYPSRNEHSLVYIVVNNTAFAFYMGLSVWGAIRSLKRRGIAYYDLFIPAYLAVILIYPYRAPTRYFLPIMPFLNLYVFESFRAALAGLRNRFPAFRIWAWRHGRIFHLRFFFPTLIYVPLFLAYWGHYAFLPTTPGANILLDPDVQGLFEKVRSLRREISGVFFWRPRILHLFTEVRTVSIYNMNEFQWRLPWLIRFASENHASHVILDPHNGNFSHFVRQNQNHFQSVYKNGTYELLQIVNLPEKTPSPPMPPR